MADNRRYVYGRLVRELGLSPAQAAGAIGGLGGESGRELNPNAVNPSSGALGIGQWLGGRQRGVQKGNLRQQTSHLIAELKGPERGALNRLRSAHNINDATRAWVEGFERPSAAEISSSMPARLGYSRDAFRAFGSGGGGGSAGGGGGGGGTTSSDGGQSTTSAPDFGAQQSALPLIQALTASQQQAPPAASIQAPDFTAHAVMPSGFGTVSGGSGPAPKPDIGALAAAVKTLGGSVPQAGVQQSQDTPATDQPTSDVSGNYPGMRGDVKFSGHADRPGVKTQPITRQFLERVAGFSHRTINVGTGTNHSQMTTSGNVSDHWTGHAADLPMPVDSKIGDLTAAHALEAAGVPWTQAIRMAQKGGVFNIVPKKGQFKGHRVQVLWKTMVGGNHHNHVHVGIRG